MIGILDLQGDVIEHLRHLRHLGLEGVPVKKPEDMDGLLGLILPGGESTCLSRLIRQFKLDVAIKRKFNQGMKIFGTCAGAILLARSITGEKPHLSLVDMVIERNGFGSQLDSFSLQAIIKSVSPHPVPLTFIRAPKIITVGSDVDILLGIDNYIAAVETTGALATIFHPELTSDFSFHRYFLRKCGLDTDDTRFQRSVGMRPGFRGTANALQGGSTPPPAAIILKR